MILKADEWTNYFNYKDMAALTYQSETLTPAAL